MLDRLLGASLALPFLSSTICTVFDAFTLFRPPPETLKQIYTFLGLEYRNVNRRQYSAISPELRQQLTEFFQPYNEKQ